LTGGGEPEIEQLGPGLHILENAPLHARSPKVDLVRRLVADGLPEGAGAVETVAALEQVLRSHEEAMPVPVTDDTGRVRPAELSAPCVHTAEYGTRSAMTVSVPVAGRPTVRMADDPSCQASLRDVTGLWSQDLAAG
jgi:uncharacterized protein with NRDE domain